MSALSRAPRLAAATVVMVGGALVLPASAQAERPASDPDAIEMVTRALAAPATVTYSGTQFIAAWSPMDPGESTSLMVDVDHSAGGSTIVRAHGADTAARLDPPAPASWLAGTGPVDLLTEAHTLTMSGITHIAGRSAVVIDAVRGDGTVAARLWLDEQMAIPLRREMYDHSGIMISASAFMDISLSYGVFTTLTSQESPDWPNPAQTLGHDDLAALRADGWSCPGELAAGLSLYRAKQVGSAVQLSYTDGVGSVSVFEQRGELDRRALAGYSLNGFGDGVYYSAPGPPSRFVWESGGYVVSVVADTPELVDNVLAVMPPESDESDRFMARVGRGAQRLVSWVNPFD